MSERPIGVNRLSLEAFKKYGGYSDMLHPEGPFLGEGDCKFYRDMNLLTLSAGAVGFSVTSVRERPLVIDELEFHTATGEAFMPIDGDIIVQLCEATKEQVPPRDKIEAFFVPAGTLITIRPGVWHGGPFAVSGRVQILAVLPERCYARDCTIVPLKPAIKIAERESED